MEVTKLRLNKTKNGNGLELSYEKPGANGDMLDVKGEIHTALIHGDLYNAIQALAPHLAVMAFHVKDVEDIAMPDPEIFGAFSVGSYSISGKDEKRGIIISGTLRKHGKAHNFNTPFYRFEEPESARYQYMDDVVARLKNIETETAEYLNGTKRGEPVQGDLGLKEEPVTKMQIATHDEKATAEGNLTKGKDRVAEMENTGGDKKKTGTKKKVVQTAEAPSGEVHE